MMEHLRWLMTRVVDFAHGAKNSNPMAIVPLADFAALGESGAKQEGAKKYRFSVA
jgi:hypothetical protein